MARTSTPLSLPRVKTSTAAPPGRTPKGARSTVIATNTAPSSRAATLDLYQIGNLYRPPLVDAVPNGDTREARHRPRARVGQPHVIRHVDLAEDQVAQAIVAPAVALGHLRHRHACALAEALGHVNLVAVGDVPRLPLERL